MSFAGDIHRVVPLTLVTGIQSKSLQSLMSVRSMMFYLCTCNAMKMWSGLIQVHFEPWMGNDYWDCNLWMTDESHHVAETTTTSREQKPYPGEYRLQEQVK